MKKDLYGVAYTITSLLIIGVVFYYQLKLQGDVLDAFSQSDERIQLAARQEMYAQQIAKSAAGMGYSIALDNANSERNFITFQNQLNNTLPLWQSGHETLVNGNEDLGIDKPIENFTYDELKDIIRPIFILLGASANNLSQVNFSIDPASQNYQNIRKDISDILSNEGRYLASARNISNYFLNQGKDSESSVGLIEQIALGSLVLLFVIQGFVIFRPLWRLASENFETANKAFVEVKKSAQELRVSYEKQKKANKQLLISRHQLAANLKKLKISEARLLKSTQEQIQINDQLILAQNNLKQTYSKLEESEEKIRSLAEKQLEDNEKLFLAEKQVQEALKQEQKRREELNMAITNLKGAQSQLVHSEKMASLGQLTAGIAHEINNPINFISSGMKSIEFTVDVVKDILAKYDELEQGLDKADEVMREVKALKIDQEYEEIMAEFDVMVRDVNYGVTRTIEIVKGLRVFSRLDEEEKKNANINENLDATLVLLRNQTNNRIKLSKFYDENMKEIDCYPGQLNQVFMNIINNAIQAIPEEREDGEIVLYTEESADDVCIRIKDNGVGIPKEVKNRIWEPFFTTKAVGVGTGLGMSITYSIIEKHHGRIELESEEGKGTEFIITIPKVANEKTVGAKVSTEQN